MTTTTYHTYDKNHRLCIVDHGPDTEPVVLVQRTDTKRRTWSIGNVSPDQYRFALGLVQRVAS